MAMFFPYFELAASLFILLLAFEIWTQHYENKLARFYAFFALVSFLAAIFTYSLRIAFTLELARDINRISASLWAFVFALFFHFVLLFTKKERFLKSGKNLLLLYAPPIILSALFLFTNFMYGRYEIVSIGIISQPAPLYLLFALETFLYCLGGIVLLIIYGLHTPQKTERTQAFLIAFGSLVAAGIGVFNDQLMPVLLQNRFTPPTVIFDIALLNFFIFIAMRNYSLFAISPALAAETIIETMPDSLLVTDLGGRIIFLNDLAKKFFRVPEDQIAGHHIKDLFRNKDDFYKIYTGSTKDRLVIERFKADIVTPAGESLPSLINARLLSEKLTGARLGIVFVIRDIRG
jgi:PAS domain S-box-containing protein